MTATFIASRKADYELDGYVVVRSLFGPDEMREAAAEADRLLTQYDHLKSVKNLRCRWQNNVLTGECTFETFDPVIDESLMAENRVRKTSLDDLLASSDFVSTACHPRYCCP